MRKHSRNRSFDCRSFWYGATAAGLIMLALIFAFALSIYSKGITVRLDSEQITLLIKRQITENTSRKLPEIIAGAKSEIPRIVKEKIEFRFSDRMEIAGFVFRVPDELLAQLRSSMQQNVEKATGMILDGINTDEIAERLGSDFSAAVKSALQEEMEGQSLHVNLWGVVPVKVRVQIA